MQRYGNSCPSLSFACSLSMPPYPSPPSLWSVLPQVPIFVSKGIVYSDAVRVVNRTGPIPNAQQIVQIMGSSAMAAMQPHGGMATWGGTTMDRLAAVAAQATRRLAGDREMVDWIIASNAFECLIEASTCLYACCCVHLPDFLPALPAFSVHVCTAGAPTTRMTSMRRWPSSRACGWQQQRSAMLMQVCGPANRHCTSLQ